MMSKIFISYRRDDSAGYAQAIYSQLVQHFSKDRVFMDVDTIEPGVDFVRDIERAVGECDVLVALIGKRWLKPDLGAKSRLDDTKDFVRLEISTALARGIRVIPVLVDGMTMPNEDILPAPIQPITRRHAIELSNTRFNFDLARLIAAVRNALGERGENTSARRRANHLSAWRLIYPVVAVLLVTVIVLTYQIYARRPTDPKLPPSPHTDSNPPTSAKLPRSSGPSSGATREVIDVPATGPKWIGTGVETGPGQSLVITASGKIVYDPNENSVGPEGDLENVCPHLDCPLRKKPAGKLLGKIGEAGSPFEIGARKEVAVVTEGQLYLGINDPYRGDNNGSFSVVIEVR